MRNKVLVVECEFMTTPIVLSAYLVGGGAVEEKWTGALDDRHDGAL